LIVPLKYIFQADGDVLFERFLVTFYLEGY